MTTALLEQEKQTTKFNFTGSGSELFGIQIVNFFLTVFTVGLYYPWPRPKPCSTYTAKQNWQAAPLPFMVLAKKCL